MAYEVYTRYGTLTFETIEEASSAAREAAAITGVAVRVRAVEPEPEEEGIDRQWEASYRANSSSITGIFQGP